MPKYNKFGDKLDIVKECIMDYKNGNESQETVCARYNIPVATFRYYYLNKRFEEPQAPVFARPVEKQHVTKVKSDDNRKHQSSSNQTQSIQQQNVQKHNVQKQKSVTTILNPEMFFTKHNSIIPKK